MVLDKIKEAFSPKTDEKYEVLYYKYSQARLEKDKLKERHSKELNDHKHKVLSKVAEELLTLYEDIEVTKQDSFKVNSTDKDIQRLLMDINKVEKQMKEIMKEFALEEVTSSERFYDPEIHEVASYQDAKGMAKGLVLKTVKKGFKFKNQIIKKPRVVVTK